VDALPHIALTLPAATGDQLPLVAGDYDFSVYVKSEIDSQVTPAIGNAFRSGQIMLGLNNDLYVISRAEGGWSSTEWVEASVTVKITQEQIDNADPLVFRISPSHPNSPKVGRILIAAPSLELAD
jgi:hypothetical protein